MLGLLFSAVVFALGLLVLGGVLPGMHVRGFWVAFKSAIVCGVLSALLGKILLVLLTLVFFIPVVIIGPLGYFAVQGFVNAILLGLTARLVDGIDFDRRATVLWAAFALTLGQAMGRWLS